MKTVTSDEARSSFDEVFQLAANGETVVIQRDKQCVTLRRFDDDIAPPAYFAEDYSREEITELNSLASHAPQVPLP